MRLVVRFGCLVESVSGSFWVFSLLVGRVVVLVF